MTLPRVGGPVRVPWGELSWAVLLTTVELLLLTLLNLVGVHEIAVATGFLTPETKSDRTGALLSIGLELKLSEVTRYGINPFEGLNPSMLFLFNLIVRLKGFLANQAIRYLTRLFLGRYAVRALLDFAGVPVYMAINAYATHAVLREGKVALMDRTRSGAWWGAWRDSLRPRWSARSSMTRCSTSRSASATSTGTTTC